jgi:hypothetical protein
MALLSLLPCLSAEANRSLDVMATPFYVRELQLAPYQVISIQTTPIGATNEVLHLLVEGPVGVWTQVASGNRNPLPPYASSLSYVNTSTKTKNYRFIIRAESASSNGYVNLIINGYPLGTFPAGGFVFNDSYLTDASGGSIFAVPQPGGSEWPAIIAFSSTGVITQLGMTGGAGGATRINSLTSDKKYMIGTPRYQQYSFPLVSARDGWARVYVNDTGDKDGDGLGDLLEQSLGHCWDNITCPNAATCKDSDRDGLPDNEELLGVVGYAWDPEDDFALPRWGADPLKKDVFLVMNWRTDAQVGNPPVSSPPTVNPFTQEPISTLSQSFTTWVYNLRTAYSEAPAHQIYNKRTSSESGKLKIVDGVSLHVDIGLDPPNPADEDKFGVWSPDIVHGINPPLIIDIRGTVDGIVSLTIDNVSSSFLATGMSMIGIANAFQAAAASQLQTLEIRLLQDPDSHLILILDSVQASGYFQRSITVPIGFEDKIKIIDQDNVTLGSYINDIRYIPKSIANRVRMGVLAHPGNGQSQGTPGRTFVASLYQEGEVIPTQAHHPTGHELGHNLGLEHWGYGTWLEHLDGGGVATNIRDFRYTAHPNYPSQMSYGFPSHYHFSTWDKMVKANPSRTPDIGAFTDSCGDIVSMNTSLYSGNPFYLATFGLLGVDWNLNGGVDNSITRFNVPLRMIKGREINVFNVGEQKILDQPKDFIGAMDIVRASNYIYALYSLDSQGSGAGEIRYRRALLGTPANASCTGPDNPLHYDVLINGAGNDTGGCLNWITEQNLSIQSKGLSSFWWNGQLFVANWEPDGSLKVYRYTVGADGALISAGMESVVGSNDHQGKPELSILYASPQIDNWSERLVLVSNEPSTNQYKFYYWNGGIFSAWPAASNAFSTLTSSPNGVSLPTGIHTLEGSGDASLAPWPDPYNTNFTDINARVTCGVFPTQTPDRILRPYCFDPVNLRWIDVLDEVMFDWTSDNSRLLKSSTPPELTFRYMRTETGEPYSLVNAPGNFQLTFNWPGLAATSVAISSAISGSNRPLWGNQPWAFTDWTMIYANQYREINPGVNTPMYEDSTMGGMFSLATQKNSSSSILYFYPHADGSPNIDFWAGSDFKVMEDYICHRVNGNQNLIGLDCGPVDVELNNTTCP